MNELAVDESLRQDYEKLLDGFRTVVDQAWWILIQAQDVEGGERRHWSSVLFIKLCLIGNSLLRLCPDRRTPWSNTTWDFSSAASIGRNFFEAAIFFNYISMQVDQQEFKARVLLMELNDAVNRLKIFQQLDNKKEVDLFEPEIERLRQELQANSYFVTLDAKLKKRGISGSQPTLMTLREMAGSLGANPGFWGNYDYLSTHSHTLPVSFFRAVSQGRHGRENEPEMHLLSSLLAELAQLLGGVTSSYRKDHETLVQFEQLERPFCFYPRR